MSLGLNFSCDKICGAAFITGTTMESLTWGRVFMGVRLEYRLSVIVVCDASKPSVSWLRIEPRVSTFLVIKSAVVVFITGTTIESLTF